ncbi:MAG: DegT/DnrJ/EryC1/StrS aminotransferase family protein [Actinobacteria bacterium]|nr:DegT/DnrJ/EryC1/StrS aminotransferase family protein [Actinomycetota bacterium]
MTWNIPLTELEYGPEEEAAVLEVLRSRWLTMGDRTTRFEQEFAEFVGSEFAVAVSNCTVGLHAILVALGIGPGDEVIVPDLTFVASLNAVRYTGATAVLADVTSENDLTISVRDVEAKITPRTRALMIMHYGGHPCDMDGIRDLAQRHGLLVVEDAAHAPGAEHRGVMAGHLGDAAAFSFFSNKNLATGEGGMVTTDREDVAKAIRLLRSHGMTHQTMDRHRGHAYSYDVVCLGYNYRLTEIEAVLGSVQLAVLPERNASRRRLVQRYRELLAGVDGVRAPFSEYGDPSLWGYSATSSHHLMVILLPDGETRARAMEGLKQRGIQTSIHYPPIHGFTNVREDIVAGRVRADGLDVIDRLAPRLLTLPLSAGFHLDVADTVVSALADALS